MAQQIPSIDRCHPSRSGAKISWSHFCQERWRLSGIKNHLKTQARWDPKHEYTCVCVCMYVCMYIYICTCIYIYANIYIYICIHTYQSFPCVNNPRCEPWCWNIYLHNWVIFGVNVGKYSSTMEHMGMKSRGNHDAKRCSCRLCDADFPRTNRDKHRFCVEQIETENRAVMVQSIRWSVVSPFISIFLVCGWATPLKRIVVRRDYYSQFIEE